MRRDRFLDISRNGMTILVTMLAKQQFAEVRILSHKGKQIRPEVDRRRPRKSPKWYPLIRSRALDWRGGVWIVRERASRGSR